MANLLCSSIILLYIGSSLAFENSESFELSTLKGSNGFKLNGVTASGFAGSSVSSAGMCIIDDKIVHQKNA